MPTQEDMDAAQRDLARIKTGWRPTEGDLATAPLIEEWKTGYMPFHPGEIQLLGRVFDHPRFVDGAAIFTSAIIHLDAEAGWARCVNRFYRLGRPEGASIN